MSQGKSILRSGLCGAMITAALAFGATQALAAPREGAGARACDSGAVCAAWCQIRGYDSGTCVSGACTCWYLQL